MPEAEERERRLGQHDVGELEDASVSSGEMRFGRMCRKITRLALQPTISAAST